MKKLQRLLIIFLAFVLISCFAACNGPGSDDSGNHSNSGNETSPALDYEKLTQTQQNSLTDDPEDFVDSETWSNFVTITCGETISVENSDETKMDVSVSGSNITVSSSKKMVLTLQGTLNGSILVTKPDGKLKLVLNGITIRSDSGPAINLQTEKRVFVEVKDGTTNTLSDGSEHPLMPDGNATKGALFSEEQLIFSGNGTLNVTGNYSHAIASDDYIRIWSGTYSLKAVKDGLRANDAIIIDGGSVSTDTNSDGMECERGYIVFNGGQANLTATDCGLKTSSSVDGSTPYIFILNGVIGIQASDDGVKSESDITVQGGYLSSEATGNAIKAKGTLSVTGGYIFAESSANDGIDSDGELSISGGMIVSISDAAESLALNSNQSSLKITGGTIAAAGNISAPDTTASTQCSVIYSNTDKNTVFCLENSEGTLILALQLNSICDKVMFSAPKIQEAQNYTLHLGGKISGENFHGLYTEGSYQKSDKNLSFTTTLVTEI